MPRQSIEQITIGSNPPGMFSGGYIYSIKFDIGYSQNLDKITISVVDGDEIELGENHGSISIGKQSFLDCYLISSEQSTAPGQKITNHTFTSKAFNLDKIFVGLVRRHCNAIGFGGDPLQEEKTVKINAKCPCNGTVKEVEGEVKRKGLITGHKVDGSLLCMAGEEPNANSCDVPEVYYSVGELMTGLQDALSSAGVSFRFESSYYYYKINYTGTVREVLSNICRDIAADFYFDWASNTVIIYDLSQGVSSLPTPPKNISASFSKSKTIENTYASFSTEFGFTPGGKAQSSYSRSKKITFTSNQDYMTPGDLSANEKTAMIGAILGKIDANARKLYYMKEGLWERIGLIDMDLNLNPTTIFEQGFDVKTYIDFHNKFKDLGVNPIFKFFIEDPKLETYWQTQEEYLFNNYGRFFYSKGPNPENKDICLGNGRSFKIDTTYIPDIQPSTRGYFIEKEPAYCPPLEDLFFYGNLEDYFPVYMDYAGQVRLSILNALSLSEGEGIDSVFQQGRLLLALVTDSKSIPLSAKFSDLNSSKNNCETQISKGYYVNRSNTEAPETDPCEGPCSSSGEEEICRKETSCGYTAISVVPNPGHDSNTAGSIQISYNGTSQTIILPVREPFYGIETKNIQVSAPFASEYKFGGEVRASSEGSAVPMKINVVTNDISNSKENATINQSNSRPAESISMKIVGITNALTMPLSPKDGLSSLSMYIDENGSFADLTYKTRAPELPSKEVALQKIRANKISIRN
jgi:hypothetical protein